MVEPQPTTAELSLLQVLWRNGPSSVRDVHASAYAGTDTGYTSALKILQNMLAKGLVTRVSQGRQHVYAAAVAERKVMNQLVRGWMDSAFSGSSLALAMQALDARPIDASELAELKALIEAFEQQAGEGGGAA